MSKIFLYGASGTGKTIIRHQLSQHLDFPLIRAEDIKDAATEAAEASGGRDDIVLLSAKEAWRRFGNLTEANIIKSLQAIRESTRKVLDPQLATYENVIIEGAFVDPRYSHQGPMFLFVIRDRARHERAYFRHRPRIPENELGFKINRIIQGYLLAEATQYPVKVVDVPTQPANVIANLDLSLS